MNDTVLTKAWAESLTFMDVFCLTPEMAERLFLLLRWPETEGENRCPICSSIDAFWIKRDSQYKCASCGKQYVARTCTTFSRCKINNHALVCFIYAAKESTPTKILQEKMNVEFKTVYHWISKMEEELKGSIYIPTEDIASNPRVECVKIKPEKLKKVERAEVAKFLLSHKRATGKDALNFFRGFCEKSISMHFKDLYFKKPFILEEIAKGVSAFAESQKVILPLQNGDYSLTSPCGYK